MKYGPLQKSHKLGEISNCAYFTKIMVIIRYASGESEQKYACNVLNQTISLTILAPEGDRRIGSPVRIGHFRVMCLVTWGRFLEGPEKFSHPESYTKISNLMIIELPCLHALDIKRGFIHKRSLGYTPLCF